MSAPHSTAEPPIAAESFQPISLGVRLATLAVIFLPLLGVVAAALFLWGWGFSWVDLGLMLGMYVVTALGITVGFHRLFVHRSFETYPAVKLLLAAVGAMAVQAPLFKWVAVHRRHHQHSDEPGDPHSPHHHGVGLLGYLRGYWHSHIGWFFDPEPADLDRYIKDLHQSRGLRVADALYPLWVVLSLALPAALGGILKGTWLGVWTGLAWGGLVRIFLVHHVTWSVNSACHLWGFQPYRTGDESRNNYLFGILAFGEGFHNTHHAFPTSARHGLRWWQLDVSYYVIRALALVGLAWNVNVPTREAQQQARWSRGGVPAEADRAGTDAPTHLPPLALRMVFWMLLGGAAGINLTQTVWHVFGWRIGEVSIAVPVGGGVGAVIGILLGLVRSPRVLVLLLAIFAGSAAGAVAGKLPWGAVGEISGEAIGGLIGGVAWIAWLLFERGTARHQEEAHDPATRTADASRVP